MIKAEELPDFLINSKGEIRVKDDKDLENFVELCERVGEELIKELFELSDYTQGFEHFLSDCEERLIFKRDYHVESKCDDKYKYKEMYSFICDILGIKDEFSLLYNNDWYHLKSILEKLDIALISKQDEFEMLYYYGSLNFNSSGYDETIKQQTDNWKRLNWIASKEEAKDRFDRQFHLFNTLKSRCIVKYLDTHGDHGNLEVSMKKVFRI